MSDLQRAVQSIWELLRLTPEEQKDSYLRRENLIIVTVVCTAWYLLLRFDDDVLYQLVFYFCVYAWSCYDVYALL